MTTNWRTEVLIPYNERYRTAYKSIGELFADLNYNQGIIWDEIEEKIGYSVGAMQKEFKKSEFYVFGRKQKPRLRAQLIAFGQERISKMNYKEIMRRFPGFVVCSYLNALRALDYDYVRLREGTKTGGNAKKKPAHCHR